MKIATLILPVDDNDGSSLEALHKAVEGHLLTHYEGFTASLIQGKWLDAGVVYEDTSIRYEVWYHERSDQATHLRDIARFCLANSKQKAIAVSFAGCPGVIDTIEKQEQPWAFMVFCG